MNSLIKYFFISVGLSFLIGCADSADFASQTSFVETSKPLVANAVVLSKSGGPVNVRPIPGLTQKCELSLSHTSEISVNFDNLIRGQGRYNWYKIEGIACIETREAYIASDFVKPIADYESNKIESSSIGFEPVQSSFIATCDNKLNIRTSPKYNSSSCGQLDPLSLVDVYADKVNGDGGAVWYELKSFNCNGKKAFAHSEFIKPNKLGFQRRHKRKCNTSKSSELSTTPKEASADGFPVYDPPQEVGRYNYNKKAYVVSPLSKGCYNFVNRDGKIGPWGKIVAQELRKHGDVFYNFNLNHETNLLFKNQCPGFAQASQVEKEYIWVWWFMALSNSESDCRPGLIQDYMRILQGAEGYPAGLLQTPSSLGGGVAQPWRPSECKGYNFKNMLNPKSNIACGVAIMRDHLKGRLANGGGFSKGIYTKHSYWEPVRREIRNGGDMMSKFINSNPLCR